MDGTDTSSNQGSSLSRALPPETAPVTVGGAPVKSSLTTLSISTVAGLSVWTAPRAVLLGWAHPAPISPPRRPSVGIWGGGRGEAGERRVSCLLSSASSSSFDLGEEEGDSAWGRVGRGGHGPRAAGNNGCLPFTTHSARGHGWGGRPGQGNREAGPRFGGGGL